jgi:hypothetical protein
MPISNPYNILQLQCSSIFLNPLLSLKYTYPKLPGRLGQSLISQNGAQVVLETVKEDPRPGLYNLEHQESVLPWDVPSEAGLLIFEAPLG